MTTRESRGILRTLWRRWARPPAPPRPALPPKIGLALGGGFARGISHVGLLRAFQRENIPLHCITGVSAGAIVAAAFASGTEIEEIARIACTMRFADVARWSICRWGLAGSERMANFLKRLLKKFHFEEMVVPLGVVATDLATGEPVMFQGKGDVFVPIRASCSYPGLFQPVRHEDRLLVDGAMSMEVPSLLARMMGATHVVSVAIPRQGSLVAPQNMLQVVNRCFQILQSRTEESWRKHSDVVIIPGVADMKWDGFSDGPRMIEAGEQAANAIVPQVKEWLNHSAPDATMLTPLTVEPLAG